MKNIHKNRLISAILIISIVVFSFGFGAKTISAASFTAMKDTMTRLKISTTADHTITYVLPTGIDFDRVGGTDILLHDFPATFTQGGTWATGDFTFNDGTARTINAVSAGAGTTDCTVADGVNNVCVAIDTTGFAFRVKPSATYTASATGATVIFTIDGTTTDGTLTNPSSAGSVVLSLSMTDEGVAAANTGSIALGIADDDQVTVSATVDPVLTFDIDAASGGGSGESSAPYTVAFGTITTTDTRVSGTTDSVQMIVLEADTNATSGVVVTVRDANGTNGLVSTSVSGDNINSADGTMADGTENYGLCVATAGLTGFARAAPYDSGTCSVDTETNAIQALTTAGENIVSTTAPVASAHAEVVANAAISGTTAAHDDYADTLTFIATGTF